MKIVVLAGGLSPERNVSLSSGTMITHALRSLGHQAALVDMYFGLEDYDGPLEAFFDRDVTDRWKQVDPKAPDLEAVKRQQLWFRWLIYLAAIFVVLLTGIYGPGFAASSFIYFQF